MSGLWWRESVLSSDPSSGSRNAGPVPRSLSRGSLVVPVANGRRTFEGGKLGPQAEPRAIQYLEHGGDIRLGDRGTRKRNLHPV